MGSKSLSRLPQQIFISLYLKQLFSCNVTKETSRLAVMIASVLIFFNFLFMCTHTTLILVNCCSIFTKCFFDITKGWNDQNHITFNSPKNSSSNVSSPLNSFMPFGKSWIVCECYTARLNWSNLGGRVKAGTILS